MVTLYVQCNIKCMYMSVLNELYRFPHFNGNFIDNNQAPCYAHHRYAILWKYGSGPRTLRARANVLMLAFNPDLRIGHVQPYPPLAKPL